MQHQDGLKDEPLPAGTPTGTASRAQDSEDENPLTRELRRDPEIARALDEGDGNQLWEVLGRKRKTVSDTRLRDAIERVRSQPRNFLMPLDSAPTMRSINGIGTTLYGRSSLGGDGTYVATLFFVVVFVPVFPFGQYLVQHAGGNSYTFFGKVPLSDFMRLWRRGFGLLLLAAVLSVVFGVWQKSSRAAVHFVSGLDVPVQVVVDGQTIDVPAGGNVERTVKSGKHHLEVRAAEGTVLEREDIDLPGGVDVVAYNVLGTAPLYADRIVYSANSSLTPTNDEGRADIYAGQTLVSRDNVDYVFEEPARTISVSKRSGSTVRWRFDVLRGGWMVATRMLASRGQAPAAAKLAERVVAIEPKNDDARNAAIFLTEMSSGPEGALALAKKWADAEPEGILAQRAWQTAMSRAGRHDEALAAARARLQKEPDSKLAMYLAARLEPPGPSAALYEKVLKGGDDDPLLVRGYAWNLHLLRRFAESAERVEQYDKMSSDDTQFVEVQAVNLVALGRVEEAVRYVAGVADKQETFDHTVATVYAHVARLPGVGGLPHPPNHYFIRAQEQIGARAARALYVEATGDGQLTKEDLAGLNDPSQREATPINVLVGTDVEAALARVKAASPEVLANIDEIPAILMVGTLLRAGDQEVAQKLRKTIALHTLDPDVLWTALQQGEHTPRFEELKLEQQAAVRFLEARAAKKPADRARLLEQARKDDALHGLVTHAIAHWKP